MEHSQRQDVPPCRKIERLGAGEGKKEKEGKRKEERQRERQRERGGGRERERERERETEGTRGKRNQDGGVRRRKDGLVVRREVGYLCNIPFVLPSEHPLMYTTPTRG